MPSDALTLGARLEQDARGIEAAQNRGEPLATGDKAALLDRAVLVGDAQLTLALVQIESYRIATPHSRSLLDGASSHQASLNIVLRDGAITSGSPPAPNNKIGETIERILATRGVPAATG